MHITLDWDTVEKINEWNNTETLKANGDVEPIYLGDDVKLNHTEYAILLKTVIGWATSQVAGHVAFPVNNESIRVELTRQYSVVHDPVFELMSKVMKFDGDRPQGIFDDERRW